MALPATLIGSAVLGEEIGSQLTCRIWHRPHWACRGGVCDQVASELAGVVQQAFTAAGQAIDHAQLQSACGADRLPGSDHLQCRLGTDQARQALGATATGQQAQADLRQAEACRGLGEAVTASQRQLQASTQGELADGGDQRFVQLGQAYQQVGQGGLGM
ncbi:hypothetical protein D3C87_1699620 [compost metagenome]